VRNASKPASLPSALFRNGRPCLARALLDVTKGGVFWIVALDPDICAMHVFGVMARSGESCADWSSQAGLSASAM
jgi:hypothetical protein